MVYFFGFKKITLKFLTKMLSKSVMNAILTIIKILKKHITLRSKDSNFVIVLTESLNTKNFS